MPFDSGGKKRALRTRAPGVSRAVPSTHLLKKFTRIKNVSFTSARDEHTVAAKTTHEASNMNVPARPPPARTSMVPLLQRPRNEPAVGVGPDRPETVRRGRGAGVGVVGGVR